jgi:hypothetical protein
MRYLNSSELAQFHMGFLTMCKKNAITNGDEVWGYPSGFLQCDTYTFKCRYGDMYLGHEDFNREQRWWMPISLQNQQASNELSIAFEMNIPKFDNKYVSVHYAIDEKQFVHILHKGKFTIGHGSASMAEFFNYYRNNPAGWPVIQYNYQDYLLLGVASLSMTDKEFETLLSSLADFANYIPDFKTRYRTTS